MNNIVQLMQTIKNPQAFITNYAINNTNPIVGNLIKMAQRNDIQGLENFARNMFKEHGQDFDKIYEQLKSQR